MVLDVVVGRYWALFDSVECFWMVSISSRIHAVMMLDVGMHVLGGGMLLPADEEDLEPSPSLAPLGGIGIICIVCCSWGVAIGGGLHGGCCFCWMVLDVVGCCWMVMVVMDYDGW